MAGECLRGKGFAKECVDIWAKSGDRTATQLPVCLPARQLNKQGYVVNIVACTGSLTVPWHKLRGRPVCHINMPSSGCKETAGCGLKPLEVCLLVLLLHMLQEHGTVMHTVVLSDGPEPELCLGLPGGGRLYITPTDTDVSPTSTDQLRQQLVHALVLLTSTSDSSASQDAVPQQTQGGMPHTQQQAPTVSPAPTGNVHIPVIKLQEYEGQPGELNITLMSMTGSKLSMQVFGGMTVQEANDACAAYLKLAKNLSLRWVYAGKQMEGSRTFGDYEVQDQDVIHIILRSSGC